MKGRIYTVEFENATWATASGDIDVLSIDAAAEKPVCLLGWEIAVLSEVAEAQEEWLRLRVIRGHTTVGSGGAAATARPCNSGDAAFSGTVRTNDTTVATAGTAVNLGSFGLQVRAGHPLGPLPEGCHMGDARGADLLVVRLMAAPADDVTVSGTLWVEEI